MKRTIVLTLVLTLLLGMFLISNIYAQDKVTLSFASGMAGGDWYGAAATFAKLIKDYAPYIEIKVLPGAGLANPPRVGTNECQLGYSFPFTGRAAVDGTGMYEGQAYPDLRAIAHGFSFPIVNIFVTAESGIKTIEEIATYKIPVKCAFLQRGSADDYATTAVFGFYGITEEDIKSWGGTVHHGEYSDLIKLIKDGQANIFGTMLAEGAAAFKEIQLSRKLRRLPVSRPLLDHMITNYSYSEGFLKKGQYEGAVEVDSLGIFTSTLLMVNKNVPDDVVYNITKILYEHDEEYRKSLPSYKDHDRDKAAFNTGAPLHPGAEKYYKEIGLIK